MTLIEGIIILLAFLFGYLLCRLSYNNSNVSETIDKLKPKKPPKVEVFLPKSGIAQAKEEEEQQLKEIIENIRK